MVSVLTFVLTIHKIQMTRDSSSITFTLNLKCSTQTSMMWTDWHCRDCGHPQRIGIRAQSSATNCKFGCLHPTYHAENRIGHSQKVDTNICF